MGRPPNGPEDEPPGPLGRTRRTAPGALGQDDLGRSGVPGGEGLYCYVELGRVGGAPTLFLGRWTWSSWFGRWSRPWASTWWTWPSAVKEDAGCYGSPC